MSVNVKTNRFLCFSMKFPINLPDLQFSFTLALIIDLQKINSVNVNRI